MQRVLVWDAPVRVVHWLIAICVLGAWLTRDARYIDWHAAAGYSALALCVFRIAWGFFGTRHARFREFAYSPRAALSYLKALPSRDAARYAGHNPAGSWSVFALLAMQLAVAITGVLASAGMHRMGPLAATVPHTLADAALSWHEIIAWAMLVVIALHVLGVAASSLAHRENLVAAMFTGRKDADPGERIERAHAGIGFAIAAGATAFAAGYLLASGAVGAKREARNEIPALALDATWRAECESCHLPYAPCMLPQRSWKAMLDGQAEHFGEDLALSESTRARLMEAAAAPAAAEPWACWKTRTSVAPHAAPLRVAETPYWKSAHENLAARDFKAPVSNGPHDCGSCHRDAASSIFHPRMIHISQ